MSRIPRVPFMPRAALAAIFAVLSLGALTGCNDNGSSPSNGPTREELIAEGQVIFSENCVSCHGEGGEGEAGPPLLHSDYLIAQRMRPVRILLMGLPNAIDTNPIVVNGITHENSMFPVGANWSDREIAAVLTYVRAVLNDSTSTDCTVTLDQDDQPVSDCDIVPSPADAVTMITPGEVKTLRDSLDAAGLLDL